MKMSKKGKKASGPGPFNLWIYGKGLMRAYFLSFILLLIGAVLLTYTSLREGMIPLFTSIVMMLSIVYGAVFVSVHLKKRGWLHGIMIGLIYMGLIVLLSKVFMTDITLDRFMGYRVLISIVTGGIGGMIGINIK
ncbi:conserved hypothetical protein [Alkaliphilus metalliredigens QYMF]|uniref:TIGR04086 family membrane protein n=2 Tax=Alkaliphilus TaxID=114627 RepID=A6TQN0_ALKMQ|nr:conserved hypothetical protein [Alkaliphilus metalliredigens QYMF]